MRVFHVVESLFKYGGANVACVDFALRQAESGHEVALFSTHSPNPEDDLRIPSYVTLYVAQRIKFAFRLSRIKGLNRLMEQAISTFKPDVVHVHALWDPVVHVAIQIADKQGIPIVHSPHGMLTPWALHHKRMKKLVAWNLYQHRDLKKVHAFHVTCEDEKQDIARLGLKQMVEIIPLGIDIPEIDLKNKKSSKRILFMSRIHPKKGLLNLVHAWDKIRKPDWKIIICGPDDDDHLKTVENEINRLDLQDSFELRGSVFGAEKDNLLRECDLFVLPTYSENFGIVVLEALSYGMPVITTHGAPWERIQDYHAGWWTEIGEQPLLNALKEYFEMSDVQYKDLSLNAVCLAKEEYSWNVVIDKLLNLYKKVVRHE